ncbi:MAG TPA: S8 family serine peptidase [Gemmatimonadaceae bacterium]|nr:S8 family serine peptidase [Gemmatimonadaceae bacterium]
MTSALAPRPEPRAPVRVAVVDSGWDHAGTPDPRVDRGIAFVDERGAFTARPTPDDQDRHGHGTACGSLVLSNAPSARVIPIRVFAERIVTSPHTLIAAIEWAAADGVSVLNLSLATLRNDVVRALYAACARATASGVVIVAAASGPPGPWSYPSVFDCVIGVRALQDPHASSITFDPDAVPECAAVGRQSVRWLSGAARAVAGPSFAAPVVSAWIAELLAEHPGLDLDGVRNAMAAALPLPHVRKAGQAMHDTV